MIDDSLVCDRAEKRSDRVPNSIDYLNPPKGLPFEHRSPRGERLELAVRVDEVPQVGVWINCAGWAPAGRRPYYHLAVAPAIGAPDRLEDAVESWGTAQTLEPGEERRWSLEVRLPED